MPCEIYKRLKTDIDIASDRYAILAYRENEHLRGAMSERKRRKQVKEASLGRTDVINELFRHTQACEECKRDRAPQES